MRKRNFVLKQINGGGPPVKMSPQGRDLYLERNGNVQTFGSGTSSEKVSTGSNHAQLLEWGDGSSMQNYSDGSAVGRLKNGKVWKTYPAGSWQWAGKQWMPK
jgi:hypothetical protein